MFSDQDPGPRGSRSRTFVIERSEKVKVLQREMATYVRSPCDDEPMDTMEMEREKRKGAIITRAQHNHR